MGESWMVDGEASVMMMAMISNSPSRQGARTESLVPNRGFWWWQRNGTLSGKASAPLCFQVRGFMYAKRGFEAVAEAATPPPGAT
jgi:hypothetical protein